MGMETHQAVSERPNVSDTEYESYLTIEWEMFARDEARARASLDAVQDRHVSSVLDIGCGAGQELRPFAAKGAICVGADVAPEAGWLGRKLFSREHPARPVIFLRSTAECLPFHPGTFDLVICRLALPYTDNRLAIAEMSRVLRPGGILLLKIHHARFYLNKFWRGLRDGNLLHSVHASRVLTSGLLYHLLGRQVRNRLVTNETFQSRHMLAREVARSGMTIIREMPDSNPRTPSFVIEKTRK
jgi:ubiquinone/menaquinone biosynthesis C-methylase UbiE